MKSDTGHPQRTPRLLGWFKGLGRVQQVLTLVATVVGLPGLCFGAWRVFFPPKPPLISTQIVLDTSERMQKLLGGGTRLDAAKEVVENYVSGRPNDNIALRSFGGGCRKNGLLVDFGRHESAAIRQALASQTAHGEGGMAEAVIRASSDFNDLERFPPESVRQVIVLTAGPDVCDPQAKQKIADRMEELAGTVAFKKIRFRYVGLGVPNNLQDEVKEFAEETDAEVDFVDNRRELHDVVGASTVPAPLPRRSRSQPTERPLGQLRLISRTGDLIADRMRGVAATEESPLPVTAPSPLVAVSMTLGRGTKTIGELLEEITVAAPEPTPGATASP